MEEPLAANQDDDAEQRRDDAEATMEAFLRAQEEAEDEEEEEGDGILDGRGGDEFEADHPPANEGLHPPPWIQPQKPYRLSYVSTSFLVALAMVVYALRTRQQWYLALVYLSSSKWAYVVLGNALIATLVSIFSIITNIFLNGLRLHEAEGLGDFFRWNITETCLALTMFRSELNVKTAILFLILVLTKCLHWVLELREQHLRMTEEAVVVNPTTGWPGIQWPHLKLFVCLMLFQLCDILAVIECGMVIVKTGPSVAILFAFEGAILLVTVMSSILLWYLHVLDGLFHYAHETTRPGSLFHGWIYPWKDYKATLVFAVEVQAQAAKFFFYVTFFAIVMTYYGLPINLFREVYMSFKALKQRVVAFGKYRRLMASMNRFENPTEAELEEAGLTCIICRDDMTVATSKRLPGCGHLFHKSCLRDWLVQQQTCPTCRGDITAMQQQQRQREAASALQRQIERQRQEQQQDENEEEEEEENDAESIGEQDIGSETTAIDGGQENTPSLIPEDTSSDDVLHQNPTMKEPPTYCCEHVPPTSPHVNTTGTDQSYPSTQVEELDRKPAAEHRDKYVRTVPQSTAGRSTVDSDALEDERPAFPAFYKVSEDDGASVYNNGEVITFEIRHVPFGVVVLGQELSWRSVDEDGSNCLMVRVPGGWVKDSQLKRITAVPL